MCFAVRLPCQLIRTALRSCGGSNCTLPKFLYRFPMASAEGEGDRSLHTESESQAKIDDPEKKKKLEMKRRQYMCGRNYKTLDGIPTWAQLTSSKVQESDPAPESPVKVDLASKISLWCGDITTLEIDAIVNAANYTLLGGGGVDGAIHRAAGWDLAEACRKLHGCETGMAKMTKGYKLPSKYVIHTVGPRGEDNEKLRQCYSNSLQLVLKHKLRSVAFPCISTGIYGFPVEPAAKVALKTVKEFLDEHHAAVDRIIFCVFMREDFEVYKNLIPEYFQ